MPWLGRARKYPTWMSLPFTRGSTRTALTPSVIRRSSRSQPVDQSLGSYFGIAAVDILPPAGLFHPVLPVRSGQELTFPLCGSCIQEEQAKPMLSCTHYCHHSDADRMLRGTWCTPELVKAIEKGYTLVKIHEVWHSPPPSNAGSVFLLITSTRG